MSNFNEYEYLMGLVAEYDPNYDPSADGIKDIIKGIKFRVQNFGKSRTNIPPKSRKILEAYGNIPIKSGKICRRPLNSILNTVVKATTSIDYDKLFHLSAHFTLENGIGVRFEKEEVVNVALENNTSGRECRPLGNVAGKTMNEIVDNTRKFMGDDQFYKYRAVTNNCQVFVRGIINGNNLSFDDSDDFILQEVCSLVKPGISKTANVLTDIANKLNLMIKGEGVGGALTNAISMRLLALQDPNPEEYIFDDNLYAIEDYIRNNPNLSMAARHNLETELENIQNILQNDDFKLRVGAVINMLAQAAKAAGYKGGAIASDIQDLIDEINQEPYVVDIERFKAIRVFLRDYLLNDNNLSKFDLDMIKGHFEGIIELYLDYVKEEGIEVPYDKIVMLRALIEIIDNRINTNQYIPDDVEANNLRYLGIRPINPPMMDDDENDERSQTPDFDFDNPGADDGDFGNQPFNFPAGEGRAGAIANYVRKALNDIEDSSISNEEFYDSLQIIKDYISNELDLQVDGSMLYWMLEELESYYRRNWPTLRRHNPIKELMLKIIPDRKMKERTP